MKKLLAPALAVCAFVLTGGLPVHAASPRLLVLRASDLGPGFTLSSARTLSNAYAAATEHAPVSLYTAHGRITGYQVDFQRTALSGIVQLESRVSQYRAAAGARWSFARSERSAKTGKDLGKSLQRFTVTGLGDQSAAYTVTGKQGKLTFTVDLVAFRRGGYVGSVQVVGIAGTFKASRVVALARIMDQRVRHSG